MSKTPTLDLIEAWNATTPSGEMDAWICRARRGEDWPGAWNADLGPRPADWVKTRCGRVDCEWCA